ncbi:tetratricopeptide repeat protein [Alkaliphilus hydrothermalis]|uniref:Tetratricopeptide (TPR) repeat protein n=1 Tax=Alkaliphilus hydrothermalis TaxID=1482730 RepID=A0ABS2NM01_9FIRM|nr:tetratricopeptide repeat protein [Alkaliphilus hydrothermalis]MBM7613972.1 tetratricopeptide (TPR) repeat protein [Alkaliphilus hydrothermalis]
MEILSPGKKIKILRKKLGLRQDQLTDERITRSLISMIENGKRRLNRKTATIIAIKLNGFYKNLGQEITPEYLLESEEQQASNIVDENMDSLKPILKNKKEADQQHVFESFERMIELANQWELQEKEAEIFIIRGKYYFDKGEYNLTLADYFNSLEYYIAARKVEYIAILYIRISKCYIKMSLFEQAAFYGDKAYLLADSTKLPNSNEIKAKSLFNKIVCYGKTAKFDLTLQEIEKFKNLKYANDSLHDEVTLIEAETFFYLKNYEKAKKIYERLLHRESKIDIDTLIRIFENASMLYNKIGEPSNARGALKKAVSYKEQIEEQRVGIFLLNIAHSYYKINDFDGAIHLLDEIMLISKEKNLSEILLTDAYILSSEIYKARQSFLQAEEYLLKSEYYLEKNNCRSKLNVVYSLLGELYCDMGNINASKVYFQKIRNNQRA